MPHLVLGLVSLLAFACDDSATTRRTSCDVTVPAQHYPLSGVWNWESPGAGPLAVCLRQTSPVFVTGLLQDATGGLSRLAGAVTAEGAIVLVAQDEEARVRGFLARRLYDTLEVFWVAFSDDQTDGVREVTEASRAVRSLTGQAIP